MMAGLLVNLQLNVCAVRLQVQVVVHTVSAIKSVSP